MRAADGFTDCLLVANTRARRGDTYAVSPTCSVSSRQRSGGSST